MLLPSVRTRGANQLRKALWLIDIDREHVRHVRENLSRQDQLGDDEPHLCFCNVRDEARLQLDLDKLRAAGIQLAEWRETDLDNQLTAIASEPIPEDQLRPIRNFQLFRVSKEATVAA